MGSQMLQGNHRFEQALIIAGDQKSFVGFIDCPYTLWMQASWKDVYKQASDDSHSAKLKYRLGNSDSENNEASFIQRLVTMF